MNISPIYYLDGYKMDHRSQFPDKTQLVYSNWTPRGSRVPGIDKVTFFGLQYFIKEYMINRFNNDFFKQPLVEVIDEYQELVNSYLGKDAISIDHIAALHKLGYLPLKIKALPEGSSVPIRVPMFTIENTHDDFFWLTNMFETMISTSIWQACTTATLAKRNRKTMVEFAEETCDNQDHIQFQSHDFSMRGMSSIETAMMSGAAHLLSSSGTDTVPALKFLQKYYNANLKTELVGASVPASEHAVMCMGGQKDEIETFKRFITETYPSGFVSVVSDTWDFWKVITEYLPVLKETILNRDGRLIIRPDSGDPADIICGTLRLIDLNLQNTAPQKGLIECLWETFGGTVNSKGYKVLNPHIGAIYGDGITHDRMVDIMTRLKNKGFASSNIVFGIGSYSYQMNTRDTFGFAMKATGGIVDDQVREIFKDPITDDGLKKSAKGFLTITRNNEGEYNLIDQVSYDETSNGELKTIFTDGELQVDWSLSEIRNNITQ